MLTISLEKMHNIYIKLIQKVLSHEIFNAIYKAFKSILWINRRNEKDVVALYNSITPFVQYALDDSNNKYNMLNFGYWTRTTTNPIEAQMKLCELVGIFADLKSTMKVIDIGSGFCAPALLWNLRYSSNNGNLLDIFCIDINLKQLHEALENIISLPLARTSKSALTYEMVNADAAACKQTRANNTAAISLVNATATTLPFANNCVDRIIALESAQHFKPLSKFLSESKRVLKPEGLIVIALPVIAQKLSYRPSLLQFAKLGILYFTWASEHYSLEKIKSEIKTGGFEIQDIQHIGHHVYAPCADYYIQNRRVLKKRLKTRAYSHARSLLIEFVERIVFFSALKMKDLSQKEIIDYVLIKATVQASQMIIDSI
jgi:cyclopropane fatty-acyl-phospholipid synthase-like methyltransferase